MPEMTAASLRIQHFTDPNVLLEAIKEWDDSFMNFALGSLLDYLNDSLSDFQARGGESEKTLIGVYQGDKLIVTLTYFARDFAWVIATPRQHWPLPAEVLSGSVSLIAEVLPSVVDPKKFDKVIGPRDLVDAFIETWASTQTANGFPTKALDAFFTAKVTYATLKTLPDPSPAFACHVINQAETDADIEAIAQLYVTFTSEGPHPEDLDSGRKVMGAAVRQGKVWVCRVDGEIGGYILVGRFTPRTLAIRNVYTSPVHRRKGVAEAMARALMRYYLGASPRGFEGGPVDGPMGGVKEEICLNVDKEEVERIYQRCGFMLAPGAQDPITGLRGWYPSSIRGVKVL